MPAPTAACVCISVCCPHFEDKRELLYGLATELVSRGVQTTVILAGRTPCPHLIRLDGDLTACSLWFEKLKGRLSRSFITEVIGHEPLLESQVEQLWARIQASEPRVWNGWRLDQISRASTVRHSLGGAVTSLSDIRAAYERDTLRHILYYRQIFGREKPKIVVYFGGQFHQDRAAFLIAKEVRAKTYALESAFVPDSIYFDSAGVAGRRGAVGAPDVLHHMESSLPPRDEVDAVDRLMIRSFRVVGLPSEATERQRIRFQMRLGPEDKMVLFLGQVAYDASVTIDGGVFASQRKALEALQLAVSAIPQTVLLVRPHPKDDPSVEGALAAAGALGVEVLKEGTPLGCTLLQCLYAADVAVTVNSQSGLQAAWLGLPVVTLGHAAYSGKGFTIDAGGRWEFVRPCLEAALGTPRGLGRGAATCYVSAIRRHMIDRPTPSLLASKMLGEL